MNPDSQKLRHSDYPSRPSNVSPKGWRLSGDLPLRIDEVCSLTVTLPTQAQVYVAGSIVRWVRGEEFGLETLGMDQESREDLNAYLSERIAS